MKKYTKVVRYGKQATKATLENNADIVIMEKLDGANASFKLEDGEIKCFSRNTELSNEDGLRGFYQWVHQNISKHDLPEGIIFYGEWLVKHKLDYGANENQFYLFDIYDEETEKYVPFNIVEKTADMLELKTVPVFYKGQFQSLEHIQSFVGKSHLGEIGEGVVVKNYKYEDKHGVQLFTKFVSDEFAEKQQVKKHRVSPSVDLLDDFVGSYLTEARVNKIIHKMVDENILEEDFDLTDMGTILKNAGGRVYEDIISEELDDLLKHVKAKIGKKLPVVVKQVITNK
ncbi:RNA ligase family protein [Rossellomorea marisflavi]|uniref:RNA ligase family protein n=1 Tax=Rossellomorea marisflavi TaxID=189381 RepID=UPI0025B05E62|nr:RNA ligase family protein [Rossellomorea marisflavi]WJV20790.1 RNA ligase family protein [Rossellomorea marisflavi]